MSHGHSHGDGKSCCGGGSDQNQQRIPTNFLQACTTGAMGIVVAFWDPIESVKMIDEQGCTALHWAALNGHSHVVRFLLDNGNPINACERSGQTALHFAASQDQCEVIEILLDAGFDPMIRDSNNNSAHGTAACNDALAALHVLQTRAPLDPNHADGQGNTLLAWGCYKGKLLVARHSHEMFNVPVETYGKLNRSPLHWAAREGHTDVCIWLMGKGLDPNKHDADGKSPLQWATERNHVECAEALRVNQKTPTDRNISTFKVMFQSFPGGHKMHLIRLAALILYAAFCYIALAYLPPVILLSMLTGWITKNNLSTMSQKARVYNHKENDPKAEIMAQMPKTFQEANEGPHELWKREPIAVFGIPLLIGLQFFSMSGGQTLSGVLMHQHHHQNENNNNDDHHNHHNHHHNDVEMAVPFAMVWCLLFAKVFAVITKALCSKDIISPDNRNAPVGDYPLFEAIDHKKWLDVRDQKDIFDETALIRKPARAFFCPQIGHVVNRFDSWSVTLDCPLSHSNMRFFLFFLISLFLSEFFLLRSAWDNSMVKNGCLIRSSGNVDGAAHSSNHHHVWAHEQNPLTSAAAAAAGNDHDHAHDHDVHNHDRDHATLPPFNNHVYNWINVLTSLLTQATPCPSPRSWLGGAPLSKLSWYDIIFGDEQVRMDALTILLPIVMLIVLGVNIVNIFRNAAACVSTAEHGIGLKCPSSEGGMTSMRRAGHGYGSVFGEGNAAGNVFLFLVGKDGERWNGCMSVPPAAKAMPQPNPMVCPPPASHKGGHGHSH